MHWLPTIWLLGLAFSSGDTIVAIPISQEVRTNMSGWRRASGGVQIRLSRPPVQPETRAVEHGDPFGVPVGRQAHLGVQRGHRRADPALCLDGRRAGGVIEGGQVYRVRTDPIGRSVFATNSAGTVVWTASWLPFGGVRVKTGAPLN
jgi:hypothetical protein